MTAQVEVKLCRVSDSHVHSGAWRDVSTFSNLVFFVCTEEPGVVALLNHDERDAGLEVHLKFEASFTHGTELVVQNLETKPKKPFNI